jgi:hypothetical protein
MGRALQEPSGPLCSKGGFVMAEDSDRVWVCRNDALEFDLEDPGIKIIRGPRFRKCLIEFEGRTHSLIKRSWNVVQKIRKLEDHSRSTNPSNIYGDKDGARTQETEGSGSTEPEIAGPEATENESNGGEPANEGEQQ